MQEANRRLIEIVKLIETNYGRDKITSNLHLSLHLYDCSFAYDHYMRSGVSLLNV